MKYEPDPRERVWQAVNSIPAGMVATYGQIAELAGIPRGARFVGCVLRDLPKGSRLPWHRVVNSQGRVSLSPQSPSARTQRERLEAEGVSFVGGRIDLRRFGWDP